MSSWLLVLSLAATNTAATVHLHQVDELACLRMGHQIDDILERGFKERRIIVECVPDRADPNDRRD